MSVGGGQRVNGIRNGPAEHVEPQAAAGGGAVGILGVLWISKLV